VDPCSESGAARSDGDGLWDGAGGVLHLAGAANETLLFQLVLEEQVGALRNLRLRGRPRCLLAAGQNIAVPVEGSYHDDAVVPLDLAAVAESARAIGRRAPPVPGRRRQAYTLEMHIPSKSPAGRPGLTLEIDAGNERCRVAVELHVYAFVLPEESSITADINNYSHVPYPGMPGADVTSSRYLEVQNEYFRMARSHRALFHLLPYSHSGRMPEAYVPVAKGWGRNRSIVDWTKFDRQWGPLLDGSAFRGCPGGARPIEYFYTPVNLMWPAHFESYGRPGYQVEFQQGIRQMAEHFAAKKWHETQFEVFFNHKARWKYFPWDMDEIYHERDNDATIDFAKWATEAVRGIARPRFINRIDSSWIFDKSARSKIGDVVQLWVVNRSAHSLSPDEVALLRRKGQTVWFYGGPDLIAAPTRLNNLQWPWMAWGRDTDGFTWWNGVGWGSWERPTPGPSFCFYDGWRFGVHGPLASLRLKMMYRGMQDVAYLDLLTRKRGSRRAAEAIVAATIGCKGREDWYQRREKAEVSGADIQSFSFTDKPWNRAPLAAWNGARARLAAAIEKS
jgi:hypothetical protein